MPSVKLEQVTPQSGVKYITTALLCNIFGMKNWRPTTILGLE